MLVMRIAIELGRWPDEVEEKLTPGELIEWAGYFRAVSDLEKQAIEDAKKKADQESKRKRR